MNLIDTYNIIPTQKLENYSDHLFKKFQNSFPELKIKSIHNSSQKTSIYLYLFKFIQHNLLSQISFNINSYFSISNILIQNYFAKCSTLQQSLFILKQFLKINDSSTPLNLIAHPQTGQINLCFKLNILANRYLKNHKFIQSLFDNLNKMEIELKKYFQLTFLLLGKDTLTKKGNILNQQKKTFNKFLKTYVNSSQYYAWTILQGTTSSQKKEKNQYEQKKKKFRNLKKVVKQSTLLNSIGIVNNQIQQTLQTVFILKVDQDQQLYQKNLVYSKSFNQQSKVINQITMHPSQFGLIAQSQLVKITTKQHGKIKVHVQKLTLNAAKNQRKILQNLPRVQFCGLPRYYIIRNNLQKTSAFRITNLIQSINLKQFLEKNSCSLSMQTKLSLINKISNSMRYLKDNSILYHNLMPENIKIKKGMITKLSDFTNSYHQNILPNRLLQNSQQRNQIFKNTFPYVSNVLNPRSKTYDNEKSDSYSLGVFIYEILFNKLPWLIKQSRIKRLQEQQVWQKICLKPIINLNEQKCYFKDTNRLLLNFLLNAMNHQKASENSKGKIINIKERPYLDWFSIISKEILNEYQQNINF